MMVQSSSNWGVVKGRGSRFRTLRNWVSAVVAPAKPIIAHRPISLTSFHAKSQFCEKVPFPIIPILFAKFHKKFAYTMAMWLSYYVWNCVVILLSWHGWKQCTNAIKFELYRKVVSEMGPSISSIILSENQDNGCRLKIMGTVAIKGWGYLTNFLPWSFYLVFQN